ncbi:hypothetical protein FH063_006295 [Azospirillum argentinense]|uniref:Uncharacterized protein n=1 Tax=Azospirillum argentinense TaxID=2970906 RepID=A0A5B0KS58_9PROT|nr:hypothetical protein FH063_006295 [Azospirillum argentinense]
MGAFAQRGRRDGPQTVCVGRRRAHRHRPVVQHHRGQRLGLAGNRGIRDVGQRVRGRTAVAARGQCKAGRRLRHVAEQDDVVADAVAAGQHVEIAVPIDVHDARNGLEGDVAQPEGVGALQGEAGRRCRSDVPIKQHVAGKITDQRVEVAVPVDVHEGRLGVTADVIQPEGIGALQREAGSRRRADVPEEHHVAVVVADQRVEVAVAVDVHEGGGGGASDAAQSEGIGAHQREGGSRRRADVAVDHRVAVEVADQRVERTVSVDVHEGRGGVHIERAQPEGVGARQREAGGRRRSIVPVEPDGAVAHADQRVEIAIAVNVGEGRDRPGSGGDETEGVGALQDEIGVLRHRHTMSGQRARSVAGRVRGLRTGARRGVIDRDGLMDGDHTGVERQRDGLAAGGDRGHRARHAPHHHREGPGRSLGAVQQLRIGQRQLRSAQHRRGQRRCRRVDGHAQRRRGRRCAGVIGAGGLRCQVVDAFGQRARREGPQARGVGGDGADRRGAIVQHHLRQRHSRAGDGRRGVSGDGVGRRAGVGAGRERQGRGRRGRWRALEVDDEIAVAIADQRVEVAVAIEVGEHRQGCGADIAQAVGVGADDGEAGRRVGADVAEHHRVAVEVADQHIEVAVVVDVHEGRRRGEADIFETEGVGADDGEAGGGCRPDVAVHGQRAVIAAEQHVEVAVTVQVPERRLGITAADLADAEGVGADHGEAGCRGGADVAVYHRIALTLAEQQVEVAVTVEVHESGRAVRGVADTEGVGADEGEAGLRRGAVVAVEPDGRAAVAGHQVEVAVAVDVDQGRPGRRANVDEAEGVGAEQDEVGIAHGDVAHLPAGHRGGSVAGHILRLGARARRRVADGDRLVAFHRASQRQRHRRAGGVRPRHRARHPVHHHGEGRPRRVGGTVQRFRIGQGQGRAVHRRRNQRRRGGVGRIVCDGVGGKAGGVGAGDGLDGVGVVARGGVGVGDGDGVRVGDRLGQRQRHRLVHAVHSDAADGDRLPSGRDGEEVGRRRVGAGQRQIVRQDQRRAIDRSALQSRDGRRRGDIAVHAEGAAPLSDQGVEIAVAIDVEERRRNHARRPARETERVGPGQGEAGLRCRADVPVEIDVAAVGRPGIVRFADQHVEVAVVVEVRKDRRGVILDVAETVGVGADEGETGLRCRTDVLEDDQPRALADHQIEVVVAVKIHEDRSGLVSDPAEAKGVGRLQREARRRGGAHVPEEEQVSGVAFADQHIELAVAVDVRQGRHDEAANVGQAERVGANQREARRCGGADVPEKLQIAIVVADQHVKVAVAVEIPITQHGGRTAGAQAKQSGTHQSEGRVGHDATGSNGAGILGVCFRFQLKGAGIGQNVLTVR